MCVLQTDRSLARKAARTLFLEDAKGNPPLIAAREALGVTVSKSVSKAIS